MARSVEVLTSSLGMHLFGEPRGMPVGRKKGLVCAWSRILTHVHILVLSRLVYLPQDMNARHGGRYMGDRFA